MDDIAPNVPTELAVPGRAERVAAVLEQPEIVLLRERGERVEIARECRRCAGRKSRASSGRWPPRSARRRCRSTPGWQSTKTGMRPFCTSGVSVVGNVTAGVMTSSPRAQAVLDLRAEQRGDHEQIRRGAGVDEIGGLAAEVVLHLALELVREGPGGQPELQDAVDADAAVRRRR